MERNKFKVGDLIRGNQKAGKYRWTTVGWEGVVVQVLSNTRVKVQYSKSHDYDVESECFDLVTANQPDETSEPSYQIY